MSDPHSSRAPTCESSLTAREDQSPYTVIGVESSQCLIELVEKRRRQCVEGLGPVQSDQSHALCRARRENELVLNSVCGRRHLSHTGIRRGGTDVMMAR